MMPIEGEVGDLSFSPLSSVRCNNAGESSLERPILDHGGVNEVGLYGVCFHGAVYIELLLWIRRTDTHIAVGLLVDASGQLARFKHASNLFWVEGTVILPIVVE